MDLDEILQILKDSGCSSNVIEHSLAVSRKAVDMASNFNKTTGSNLNMENIREGALLHDIGRSKTHSIKHAVVGAEILKDLDFPHEIINITLKHIGAGIPPSEAAKLGLPAEDYMPHTMEEKIVAHADNLTNGEDEVDLDFVLNKWERIFGKDHPAISRLKKLDSETNPGL